MNRVDVVRQALKERGPDATYLEIGLRRGATFRQIQTRTKIGVDPVLIGRRLKLTASLSRPKTSLGVSTGTFVFQTTSDRLFQQGRKLLRRRAPNVVLIDGLHTSEQSFRDVENCLSVLDRQGLLVLHDCNPQSAAAAYPTQDEALAREQPGYDGLWNGDVWKTIVRLRASRDDLRVCVIDCDQGLGLVARGTPDSRLTLSENEIEEMTYSDLEADRESLLALTPWTSAGPFIEHAMTP